MRQIEMLVQAIARVLFHKDSVQYEIADAQCPTRTDLLFGQLERMINEGRFGEAEDLLFDSADYEDRQFLMLALHFYQSLNALDEATLEAGGFSRDEIEQGLRSYMEKTGLDLQV